MPISISIFILHFKMNMLRLVIHRNIKKDDCMTKKKIVFLTGAGISKESGIPTFRDTVEGLWKDKDNAKLSDINGAFKHVYEAEKFFNLLKQNMLQASPNQAHYAISELAKNPAFDVTVITQNIDDLHRRSGIDEHKLIEVHGNIFRNICRSHPDITNTNFKSARGCYYVGNHYDQEWKFPQTCPRCHKPSTFSPDVVLFGEALDTNDLIRAEDAIIQADIIIFVGTSFEVHPIASVLYLLKGKKTININIEPFNLSEHRYFDGFSYEMIGNASILVPDICIKIENKDI